MDKHTETAAIIHGIETIDVTPEMRERGKILNFGVCYGGQLPALKVGCELTNKEAERVDAEWDNYFAPMQAEGFDKVKCDWCGEMVDEDRTQELIGPCAGQRVCFVCILKREG